MQPLEASVDLRMLIEAKKSQFWFLAKTFQGLPQVSEYLMAIRSHFWFLAQTAIQSPQVVMCSLYGPQIPLVLSGTHLLGSEVGGGP